MTAFLYCLGVAQPAHPQTSSLHTISVCQRVFVAPAQVRDFFQKVQLSPIDTYFMIDCINGGKVPAPVDPSKIVG